MSNGFDRLERFFSKRKASPVSVEASILISQPSEPQFPSPSFINPTTIRMTARDEVRLRHASERSPSVPDIASLRLGSSDSRASGSALNLSPVHSPSPTSRRPEPLVMGLREFRFPNPPTRNGEITPLSATFNCMESPQSGSPRSRSPLDVNVSSRLDTPPSSDPEDDGTSLENLKNTKFPKLLYGAPPTPEDSPELGPVPDSPLSASEAFDMLDRALFSDFEDQLGDNFDQLSLNGTCSEPSVAPSPRISCCSSTLREPDFNDFLNLSDDDIAESTPDSPTLDPQSDSQLSLPPMDLSIASSEPLSSSLLTLTPPRASRPATAAAFEAARIAKRYDFDLVYVVNLWPGSPRSQTFASGADGPSEQPLIGRLLAAHGLHNVPSPLQISSFVHTTILRSDGWIEYRNTGARPQDLARGYACAFYTGQYARGSSGEPSGPVSGVRLSEKIDRGIVFAAYRKPRLGETKLGHNFTEEKLGDLHRDAEVLVEMLIDIHAANRKRQPPSHHRLSDETGPMPLQELQQLF